MYSFSFNDYQGPRLFNRTEHKQEKPRVPLDLPRQRGALVDGFFGNILNQLTILLAALVIADSLQRHRASIEVFLSAARFRSLLRISGWIARGTVRLIARNFGTSALFGIAKHKHMDRLNSDGIRWNGTFGTIPQVSDPTQRFQ